MEVKTSCINCERVKKRCCGVKGLRLNSRRFSIQRLRNKFFYLLRVFRRFKRSCRRALRSFRRSLVRRKNNDDKLVQVSNSYVYYYSGGARSLAHSNSFCSEAIADCLDFIKRNSGSIEDEMRPMLNQE